MKLHVEGSEVNLVAGPSGNFDGAFGVGANLRGRSRIELDNHSDSPTSDDYTLPRSVGSEKLDDIWLPTFVRFSPPLAFENRRVYKTDFLDNEAHPPRGEGRAAVASIYYDEAGSEFSEYNGGDATLSIDLKWDFALVEHTHELLTALQNPALQIKIYLDAIYFTCHESIHEKFGTPTWNRFLASECSAYAADYRISFTRTVGVSSAADALRVSRDRKVER